MVPKRKRIGLHGQNKARLKPYRISSAFLLLVLILSVFCSEISAQDSIVYLRPYVQVTWDTKRDVYRKHDRRLSHERRIDSMLFFGLKEFKVSRRTNLHKVKNSPIKKYITLFIEGQLTDTDKKELIEAVQLSKGERYILITVIEPKYTKWNSWNGIVDEFYFLDSKTLEIKHFIFKNKWANMKGRRGKRIIKTFKELIK